MMQAVLQRSSSTICRPTCRQVRSPEAAVLLVLRRDRFGQHLCWTLIPLTFVSALLFQQLASPWRCKQTTGSHRLPTYVNDSRLPWFLCAGEMLCVWESDYHASPHEIQSWHSNSFPKWCIAKNMARHARYSDVIFALKAAVCLCLNFESQLGVYML